MIEQKEKMVRVRVRVQPRASRTEIVGRFGDALKVRVAASPVDGAANRELIRLISKRLGVATSRVRLLAGEASRSKLLEIADADHDVVRKALLE